MTINVNINGEAIKELRKVLEYPPYLIFVFIGAVFVFGSLVWENNFSQVWAFFLYAALGSIWRYIEKDIYKNIFTEERYPKLSKTVLWVYHLGNLALFGGLFYYLVSRN